jgi:hypothetical protein
LVVDRGVIPDHLLRKGAHIFVLRFVERLFAGLNSLDSPFTVSLAYTLEVMQPRF